MSKHELTMYLYNRAIESSKFVTALRKAGFDWELRDKFLDHSDNLIAAGAFLQNLEGSIRELFFKTSRSFRSSIEKQNEE